MLAGFQNRHIRYALIGGFALSLWGVPRATVVLDFLVNREDMAAVHDLMVSLGYSRYHHSDNVSQYLAAEHILGEVDFLHAFRPASLGMLKRTVPRELFGRTMTVQVISLEDLIGLKIQALVHDPTRRATDLADIEDLLAIHQPNLDWDLLMEYFLLFGQHDLLKQLQEKYG